MLTTGKPNESVTHFANAVCVCPQPAQLLTVLCKTLPREIYRKLEYRIALMKLADRNQKSSS